MKLRFVRVETTIKIDLSVWDNSTKDKDNENESLILTTMSV